MSHQESSSLFKYVESKGKEEKKREKESMKKGRESKRGRQRKGKEGRKETAINQPKLIDIENALVAVRGGG